MAHVEASAHVRMEPDALWRRVGSFQGVGEWHPLLAKVEGRGEQPGSVRKAMTHNGQEQVERLLEISPSHHFYRYAMVSSPMPLRSYVGDLRVRENQDGTSTVLWTSDFVATQDDGATEATIRGFLEAGMEGLRERYS